MKILIFVAYNPILNIYTPYLMDNKALTPQIAKRMRRQASDVNELFDGLAQVMKQCFVQLDSVAIPGFGKFEAVKEDEKIVTDLTTGQRVLLPPAISVSFSPSSLLKKRVLQSPTK